MVLDNKYRHTISIKNFSIFKDIKNYVKQELDKAISAEKEGLIRRIAQAQRELEEAKQVSYDSAVAYRKALNNFYDKAEDMINEAHGFVSEVRNVEIEVIENPYYGTDFEKEIKHYKLMLGDKCVYDDYVSIGQFGNIKVLELLQDPNLKKEMQEHLNDLQRSYNKAKITLENYQKDYDEYSKKLFKSKKELREKRAKVDAQMACLNELSSKIESSKQAIQNFEKDFEELKSLNAVIIQTNEANKNAEKARLASENKLAEVQENKEGVLSFKPALNGEKSVLVIDTQFVTDLVDSQINQNNLNALRNDNFFVQTLINESLPRNDFPGVLNLNSLDSKVDDYIHLKLLDEFYKVNASNDELTE